MTEETSLNINKDHSGGRRTQRTQGNNIFLQEKLIMDPRISAKKNGLDISKSAFNQITKRDFKWVPNKMHARKEINNYKRS